VIAGYFI